MMAFVGVVPQLQAQNRCQISSKQYQKKIHPSAPPLPFEGDREGISHLLTEKLDYYGKSQTQNF